VKIAVIGANGQLGVDVCNVLEALGHKVFAVTHEHLDIANAQSIVDAFTNTHLEAVVNTAAVHNVEQCELDPAKAFAVNALGVRNLARFCEDRGIYLIHISTDYVFDGAKKLPYAESDAPFPLNVYGNSKLAGEYFVRASCRQGCVLRVSGIYGKNPCRAKRGGLNFVQLMLKLASERPEIRVVDDEVLTPNYSMDIANQIAELLRHQLPGLFHGTAQGACSWYEFAQRIFEKSGTSANLQKARPNEFPAKVARPSYSVLENLALQKSGLDVMPSWQDGLDRYLTELGIIVN